MDPRGLCHACPTGAGATRRVGAETTSSSSAASADEPSTPFGLGERRVGEVEPEPDPEAGASPAGRAIGAIGRVIGPGSAAIEARLPGADCDEGREPKMGEAMGLE